jgi:hypothetical protein
MNENFENKESFIKNVINEVLDDTIKSLNSSTKNPCLVCNEITIPKDSLSFELLYGYPNGTRQEEAYEDIQLYFKCLNECYNHDNLLMLVELSAKIKYDADGPSHLQSNFQEYIEKNKDLIYKIYEECKCDIFEKHIKFLFEGVDFNRINEMNEILNSLDFKDTCKSKAIRNISKRKTQEY